MTDEKLKAVLESIVKIHQYQESIKKIMLDINKEYTDILILMNNELKDREDRGANIQ